MALTLAISCSAGPQFCFDAATSGSWATREATRLMVLKYRRRGSSDEY
jgi:hypothetical protein